MFGYMGASVYTTKSNLFDDLFYSDSTPFIVLFFIFTYSILVVMPVVAKFSQFARNLIYFGGLCDAPFSFFSAIALPWILGAIVNHLQVFLYLVDRSCLLTGFFVQFVCPLFMWARAVEEQQTYEDNKRDSMQQIMGDKEYWASGGK